MSNNGFRKKKSLTKKEIVADVIAKHKAGAVDVSDKETQTIAMEQSEEREKIKALWNYFNATVIFKRQTSELEDLQYTLKFMRDLKLERYRNSDGIFVSQETIKLKTSEYFFAYKQLAGNIQHQMKVLKDVWKLSDDDIEKKYQEMIVGKGESKSE